MNLLPRFDWSDGEGNTTRGDGDAIVLTAASTVKSPQVTRLTLPAGAYAIRPRFAPARTP